MNENVKTRRSILPVASLLLAAILWGLFWYPLRLLNDHGLSGVWTSLVIYLIAMIVGSAFFWPYRRALMQRPLLLLLMGLASGWCNVSFIIAVIEGNVLRVVMLFYLAPLWTVMLGRIFLKEKLSFSSWLVLIFAMSGAVVMLWDPDTGLPWPHDRADWLALSSGFTFALANVIIRGLQDVPVQTKTMAVWIGVALVSLCWVVVTGEKVPDVSYNVLLACMALGIFGVTLMTYTVQYGVTHMPVYRSAVILLFEIFVAALSAQLLTNETMLLREWAGGALIIMATLESVYMHFKSS